MENPQSHQNEHPKNFELLVSIWRKVGQIATVVGTIAATYYVVAGVTPLTDLFILGATNPKDILELAKSVFIGSALILAVALFMRTKLTTQAMQQSTSSGIPTPTMDAEEVKTKENARLAAIRKLFEARILGYIGWFIVGYYVYSVVTIRIDMGSQSWGAVGGLSVFFLAPYLIIGIILAAIGSSNARKAMRNL